MLTPTRRWLLGGLVVGGVGASGYAARRYLWPATPGSTAGPFYPEPDMRLSEVDADLLRMGAGPPSAGIPLRLTGRLLGQRQPGPIPGALVEIWQVDANGRYLHPGDARTTPQRDAAFQGYGRARTGTDGSFEFQTIQPVPYPGRTPHIHMRISTLAGAGLTTQLYLEDHPMNLSDAIYRRMTWAERRRVGLRPISDPTGLGTTAQVDIVI
ncbi:MAG: protocatechuate 3,4-dioxygenase [Pseudomonadota bacterium]